MPDGLTRAIQDDFAVGVQLDIAPHLVDSRSSLGLTNVLLGDDGSPTLRGGSIEVADFGSHLRSIWDGWLIPGHRTVLANTDEFGVLNSTGDDVIALGGNGAYLPRRAQMVEGLLFLPPGWIYGGSRKSAAPALGTVIAVTGQSLIRGIGTNWLDEADPGMIFKRRNERAYVVASVHSDTELELAVPYEGVTTYPSPEATYQLAPLIEATIPYKVSEVYGEIADRLIVLEDRSKWRFSERSKPHSFIDTDYHELAGGLNILGTDKLDNDAFVFHTQGYTLIRNMAYNLTDALGNLQQREVEINRSVVLWGDAGICGYSGALVIPALDAIYLIDAVQQPVPISKAINLRYRRHVDAGRFPGQAAIFRDHYCLPVVDAGGAPIDLLTVRLDRSVTGRSQTFFPWTWQEAAGGLCSAMATRSPGRAADRTVLLGSARAGKLIDATRWFHPGSYVKLDHDGDPPQLELLTRAFATGPPNTRNRARRLRLLYELIADPGDDARIRCEYTMGKLRSDIARWDERDWDDFDWEDADDSQFDWVDVIDPDTGLVDYGLPDDGTGGKDFYLAGLGRFIRFRLRSSGPCARLAIRSAELFTAVSGRARHTRV